MGAACAAVAAAAAAKALYDSHLMGLFCEIKVGGGSAFVLIVIVVGQVCMP